MERETANPQIKPTKQLASLLLRWKGFKGFGKISSPAPGETDSLLALAFSKSILADRGP
jgi:hypothetical protein